MFKAYIADLKQKEEERGKAMSELKIGDKVVMNGKYRVSEENKGVVFTVISKPYRVCGVELVNLKDRSGGYAVEGLSKVIDKETDKG